MTEERQIPDQATVDPPAAPGPEAVPPGKPLHRPTATSQKKARCATVIELVRYAYAERGRKLALARRDLKAMKVDGQSLEDEVQEVRRLSREDPNLAVPPSLLAAVADAGLAAPERRRLVDLALVAMTSHELLATVSGRLVDPHQEPQLRVRDFNYLIKDVGPSTGASSGPVPPPEVSRERLRVNAVTAYCLIRVLRDRVPLEAFIEDMSTGIWTAERLTSPARVAAVLATARNSEALSQLARYYEQRAERDQRALRDANAETALQIRQVTKASEQINELAAEVQSQQDNERRLALELERLRGELADERSRRTVDTSHLMDDFEGLRTQVLRRLAPQADLLRDGLHALRAGRTGVAEEFVDRSLTALDAELARLKGLDGGTP